MKGLSSPEQNFRIMYCSEDFERFYFQYQSEVLPHGESLQSFCVKNKVPYNIFQKWYRDTRKKVVEVWIDGIPVANSEEKAKTSRLLSIIRERLHCEPIDGDVFIVMSRNRREVVYEDANGTPMGD